MFCCWEHQSAHQHDVNFLVPPWLVYKHSFLLHDWNACHDIRTHHIQSIHTLPYDLGTNVLHVCNCNYSDGYDSYLEMRGNKTETNKERAAGLQHISGICSTSFAGSSFAFSINNLMFSGVIASFSCSEGCWKTKAVETMTSWLNIHHCLARCVVSSPMKNGSMLFKIPSLKPCEHP